VILVFARRDKEQVKGTKKGEKERDGGGRRTARAFRERCFLISGVIIKSGHYIPDAQVKSAFTYSGRSPVGYANFFQRINKARVFFSFSLSSPSCFSFVSSLASMRVTEVTGAERGVERDWNIPPSWMCVKWV